MTMISMRVRINTHSILFKASNSALTLFVSCLLMVVYNNTEMNKFHIQKTRLILKRGLKAVFFVKMFYFDL